MARSMAEATDNRPRTTNGAPETRRPACRRFDSVVEDDRGLAVADLLTGVERAAEFVTGQLVELLGAFRGQQEVLLGHADLRAGERHLGVGQVQLADDVVVAVIRGVQRRAEVERGELSGLTE